MAMFAKIIGFLCMFGAVFEVLLGIARILTAEGGEGDLRPGDGAGLTAWGALALGLVVLFFLMLLAVGAAAFVIGEIAERQVEDLRRRAAQAAPGQYGASLRSMAMQDPRGRTPLE